MSRETLIEMLLCCEAWEPNVCIMGNVRCADAAKALRDALAEVEKADPEPVFHLRSFGDVSKADLDAWFAKGETEKAIPAASELIAMARRYQALKDSGAYRHGHSASCPWGLRIGGRPATSEELDAAIDAAMEGK